MPSDTNTARAYGVLATSFSEALSETRSALAPHAQLLDSSVLPHVVDLLGEFARKRVRIAVYGEVKAGKSTLVNAISGAVLSPTAFDPLTSVPIRITHGPATSWHTAGRTFERAEELAQAMREGLETSDEVTVTTDLDLLKLGGQVDLVDTPGVGSEDHLDVISGQVLRTLDAVVLVVRYPALFTQFTRRLVEQLQGDISKLFVVWNLDGACQDLSDEERERQREALRANVAGAHELFLVDAKRGFEASSTRAAEGRDHSGLAAFVDGISSFAGSNKRDIAALREASKGALACLEGVFAPLEERRKVLDETLTATRGRLSSVERQAEERGTQERTTFATLQKGMAQAGDHHMNKARALATTLRQKIRTARRGWVRRANLDQLKAAIDVATAEYADAVDLMMHDTTNSLRSIAQEFGASVSLAARERVVPSVDTISPSERADKSRSGSLALVRRALWRNWYLPGLTSLLTTAIDDDIASQQNWFDTSARSVEAAAQDLLDTRLSGLRAEANASLARIKQETNYDLDNAEFEALTEHLPTLRSAKERIAEIGGEAWYLN